MVDLIEMKAIYFDGESGEKLREEQIPASLLEFAKSKKQELVSVLAENDEKMEEYFLEENFDIPADELNAEIRKQTIAL